jgi:hypothetical protein
VIWLRFVLAGRLVVVVGDDFSFFASMVLESLQFHKLPFL